LRKMGKVLFRKAKEQTDVKQTVEEVQISIELVEMDEETHIQFDCPVCHNKIAIPAEVITDMLQKRTLPDKSCDYVRRGTR